MSPLRILLALLLIVPVVEIYLFIKVGGLIGVLPTLLLVLFSAVMGVVLLRQQGFATLMRLQASLARGEIPAIEMLEGALLLIGGVLLLTPGFFTDVLGFLCLIPALRRRVVLWAIRRGVVVSSGLGAGSPPHGHGPRTLEGEFWKDDERR
jgi:UPF0716 protein FxsA